MQAGEEESRLATRFITPTRSYLSQIEPVATFGFPAEMQTVPILKIRWPDGTWQVERDIALDQTITVVKE